MPAYEIRGDLLCWHWTGSVDTQGTPIIRLRKGSKLARRYYWERENGPIPEGLILIRLCQDAACVRPRHYVPGTWSEWHRKMGRTKMSLRSAKAALLMRNQGVSRREVGRILGVSEPVIKELEDGLHWTVRKGGRSD